MTGRISLPFGSDLEPFGTPDGARADLEEIDRDFVEFSDGLASKGVALKESDVKTRVIVGKKGAGKTVYLRRAQAFAIDARSLYADDSPHSPPSTRQVVTIGEWYGPETIIDMWANIWKVAILRALVSQLWHSDHLRTQETRQIAESISVDYSHLCPKFKDEFSVYSQVRAIIDMYKGEDGADELETYVNHYEWEAVERRSAKALRETRPVCFYLDAIDEGYQHAPSSWLSCQQGLFHQVMQFLRDKSLGEKLRIYISIRDHVYATVFQSEHLTRYMSRSHVRLLDWDEATIHHLLEEKLDRLDNGYFFDRGSKSVEGWLGTSYFLNGARLKDGAPREERIEAYLFRHTRMIPRDIIILSNMLSSQVLQAKSAGKTAVDPALLQRVVSRAAVLFGQEQLAICGNQIASDEMPDGAVGWDLSELWTAERFEQERERVDDEWGISMDAETGEYTYTGLEHYRGSDPATKARAAYQKVTLDRLKTFIAQIGRDRFGRKEFDIARVRGTELFPGADPLSVLWQSGLLGYTEGRIMTGDAVFFGDSDIDPLRVPDEKRGYALHPCLIDCLKVKPVGAPVYPRRCS